jgi:hypothetical protein
MSFSVIIIIIHFSAIHFIIPDEVESARIYNFNKSYFSLSLKSLN